MLKHQEVNKECSSSQRQRWVRYGLLEPPQRGSGKGHEGAAWIWPDDTVDRVRFIKMCLEDNPNLDYVAFELFLSGYALPANTTRKVLDGILDAQYRFFFHNHPTIPSEPLPNDRRWIQRQHDKFLPEIGRFAQEHSFGGDMLQFFSLFTDTQKYLADVLPTSSNLMPEVTWLTPFHEQRKHLNKASDVIIQAAVSQANVILNRFREDWGREFYTFGITPGQVTQVLLSLSGYTGKQPHTLLDALRPDMTVFLLTHPDLFADDQYTFANYIADMKKHIEGYFKVFREVSPSLSPILEYLSVAR